MKLSDFFIDRPIFAAVLSTFITIGGAIALLKLPISEYPEVVPPSVVVRATYPGANPKVVADTVAAPKDQPYQERNATVRDSFGNIWYISTYKGRNSN